jgi:hypothetical protein
LAVDTRQKRMSMLNFGDSSITLFEADNSVDLDDRQHLLDCYSGIAFGAPPGGTTIISLAHEGGLAGMGGLAGRGGGLAG